MDVALGSIGVSAMSLIRLGAAYMYDCPDQPREIVPRANGTTQPLATTATFWISSL
jgi:hypothetical protein